MEILLSEMRLAYFPWSAKGFGGVFLLWEGVISSVVSEDYWVCKL